MDSKKNEQMKEPLSVLEIRQVIEQLGIPNDKLPQDIASMIEQKQAGRIAVRSPEPKDPT